MKIVTCITRLIRGGAQRVALETAALLAARGHDAPLWCGPETGAEGSLHEEAAARGVRVRIFPHLRRAVRPWHDALALVELTRALRSERPDLLHTHSSKAGILGREAARRAGTARVVHTVHGWGFTPNTSRGIAAAYAALERRCAGAGPMVFVNPSDEEEGLRRGIVPPPLSRVIAPGINLNPYRESATLARMRRDVRESLQCPQNAVVGGFLGRLSEQKAPEILLAVATIINQSNKELRWLVVGDGPMGGALRARAGTDDSLRGRLHWAGLQESPARWLAAMDFLLLPSRWEGTPLTLMEGMAAGLPVVASDLPGVRWLLQGQEETTTERLGLLVPSGNVAAFADAAGSLALDPQLRRTLGSASRNCALARFGLDTMIEKLLYLYAVTP